MKIALTSEIKKAENALIASGVSAELLMEEAGQKIARVIREEWGKSGLCVAYLGKGNNAGDALVVLRYLRQWGWDIAVRPGYLPEEGSVLYKLQWNRLENLPDWKLERLDAADSPVVLLDGLVGLGAKGGLKGRLAELAAEMNSTRRSGKTRIVAIDFPSGVDGDTGEVFGNAVMADCTAMIAIAKQGVLNDPATGHAGRIFPIHLSCLDVPENNFGELFDKREGTLLLPLRPYEWFKGNAGRVSVIAGSRGMTGAARLCAESALRAGAGMVTLFALPDVYEILAGSVMPEVMVKPVQSYTEAFEVHCDALLVGPGLGKPEQEREGELLQLIGEYIGKTVLDADALNLIARNNLLGGLGENHLLTPHVGEMERLLPRFPDETRKERVLRFTRISTAALLLKGARTLVGQRGRPIRYNSSGGPGMGTAGEGDVLSGVCAALCAQGLSPYDSAALGAWLCGRSSELALRTTQSEQSLIASDTISYLGRAFNDLRS